MEYQTDVHIIQRDRRTSFRTKNAYIWIMLCACIFNIVSLVGFYIMRDACITEKAFYYTGFVFAGFLTLALIANIFAVFNPNYMWRTWHIVAECIGFDVEDCEPYSLMLRSRALEEKGQTILQKTLLIDEED